jgi:hypothetical protein
MSKTYWADFNYQDLYLPTQFKKEEPLSKYVSTCSLCNRIINENDAIGRVWDCGHIFHEACILHDINNQFFYKVRETFFYLDTTQDVLDKIKDFMNDSHTLPWKNDWEFYCPFHFHVKPGADMMLGKRKSQKTKRHSHGKIHVRSIPRRKRHSCPKYHGIREKRIIDDYGIPSFKKGDVVLIVPRRGEQTMPFEQGVIINSIGSSCEVQITLVKTNIKNLEQIEDIFYETESKASPDESKESLEIKEPPKETPDESKKSPKEQSLEYKSPESELMGESVKILEGPYMGKVGVIKSVINRECTVVLEQPIVMDIQNTNLMLITDFKNKLDAFDIKINGGLYTNLQNVVYTVDIPSKFRLGDHVKIKGYSEVGDEKNFFSLDRTDKSTDMTYTFYHIRNCIIIGRKFSKWLIKSKARRINKSDAVLGHLEFDTIDYFEFLADDHELDFVKECKDGVCPTERKPFTEDMRTDNGLTDNEIKFGKILELIYHAEYVKNSDGYESNKPPRIKFSPDTIFSICAKRKPRTKEELMKRHAELLAVIHSTSDKKGEEFIKVRELRHLKRDQTLDYQDTVMYTELPPLPWVEHKITGNIVYQNLSTNKISDNPPKEVSLRDAIYAQKILKEPSTIAWLTDIAKTWGGVAGKVLGAGASFLSTVGLLVGNNETTSVSGSLIEQKSNQSKVATPFTFFVGTDELSAKTRGVSMVATNISELASSIQYFTGNEIVGTEITRIIDIGDNLYEVYIAGNDYLGLETEVGPDGLLRSVDDRDDYVFTYRTDKIKKGYVISPSELFYIQQQDTTQPVDKLINWLNKATSGLMNIVLIKQGLEMSGLFNSKRKKENLMLYSDAPLVSTWSTSLLLSQLQNELKPEQRPDASQGKKSKGRKRRGRRISKGNRQFSGVFNLGSAKLLHKMSRWIWPIEDDHMTVIVSAHGCKNMDKTNYDTRNALGKKINLLMIDGGYKKGTIINYDNLFATKWYYSDFKNLTTHEAKNCFKNRSNTDIKKFATKNYSFATRLYTSRHYDEESQHNSYFMNSDATKQICYWNGSKWIDIASSLFRVDNERASQHDFASTGEDTWLKLFRRAPFDIRATDLAFTNPTALDVKYYYYYNRVTGKCKFVLSSNEKSQKCIRDGSTFYNKTKVVEGADSDHTRIDGFTTNIFVTSPQPSWEHVKRDAIYCDASCKEIYHIYVKDCLGEQWRELLTMYPNGLEDSQLKALGNPYRLRPVAEWSFYQKELYTSWVANLKKTEEQVIFESTCKVCKKTHEFFNLNDYFAFGGERGGMVPFYFKYNLSLGERIKNSIHICQGNDEHKIYNNKRLNDLGLGLASFKTKPESLDDAILKAYTHKLPFSFILSIGNFTIDDLNKKGFKVQRGSFPTICQGKPCYNEKTIAQLYQDGHKYVEEGRFSIPRWIWSYNKELNLSRKENLLKRKLTDSGYWIDLVTNARKTDSDITPSDLQELCIELPTFSGNDPAYFAIPKEAYTPFDAKPDIPTFYGAKEINKEQPRGPLWFPWDENHLDESFNFELIDRFYIYEIKDKNSQIYINVYTNKIRYYITEKEKQIIVPYPLTGAIDFTKDPNIVGLVRHKINRALKFKSHLNKESESDFKPGDKFGVKKLDYFEPFQSTLSNLIYSPSDIVNETPESDGSFPLKYSMVYYANNPGLDGIHVYETRINGVHTTYDKFSENNILKAGILSHVIEKNINDNPNIKNKNILPEIYKENKIDRCAESTLVPADDCHFVIKKDQFTKTEFLKDTTDFKANMWRNKENPDSVLLDHPEIFKAGNPFPAMEMSSLFDSNYLHRDLYMYNRYLLDKINYGDPLSDVVRKRPSVRCSTTPNVIVPNLLSTNPVKCDVIPAFEIKLEQIIESLKEAHKAKHNRELASITIISFSDDDLQCKNVKPDDFIPEIYQFSDKKP